MEIRAISPRASVTGQIHPDDLGEIARLGFVAIFNDRPDNEEPGQPASNQLAEAAASLGLDYFHIPIVPGKMTDADARALGQALTKIDRPVLGFCRTGKRAEDLWRRACELGLVHNQ